MHHADDDETRNQGEGNPEADRNYRESTREFVESGKVADAADKATSMTDEERKAAIDAEKAGREKAKK